MKFNFPIEINMNDFVKKGKFDCIQLGQTKEWILSNFPDPDYYDDCYSMSYKDKFWGYGSFEFIFDKNLLVSIFCHHLDFDGGDSLKIDKWVFEEAITLIEFIEILNRDGVDFSLTHKKWVNSEVWITISDSKVVLAFNGEGKGNCNNFGLQSINLSSLAV